jgi:ribokinase
MPKASESVTHDSIAHVNSQGPVSRVVIVGSLNIDLVVNVDRLPGSGETVFGNSLERHPGGKGLNQAVAAARLGATVSMIGAVGDDGSGEWLRRVVIEEGIDDSGISVAPGTSGTAVIEVEPRGENRIIVVAGANETLTAEAVRTAIESFNDVAVVLTQSEVPVEAVRAAMAAGRAAGAKTILNPAPARDYPSDILANVDILIPNEHEAAEMSGLETGSALDTIEVAQELNTRGALCVVITRGERGAVWSTAGNSGQAAAFRVSAIDTVAAGDAFCGGMATAISMGIPFSEALRWASAAGALTATRRGAVPSLPTRDEVEEMLANN